MNSNKESDYWIPLSSSDGHTEGTSPLVIGEYVKIKQEVVEETCHPIPSTHEQREEIQLTTPEGRIITIKQEPETDVFTSLKENEVFTSLKEPENEVFQPLISTGDIEEETDPSTQHENMASNEEMHAYDQDLSTVLVEIIKEFPELLGKSQLAEAKEKKYQALQEAKQRIQSDVGKKMEEKQIMKKIANMKASVKKKTDANQTGNRKTTLCPWEMELYNILQGDENRMVNKMAYSISAGFSTGTSTGSSSSHSSTSTQTHEEASEMTTLADSTKPKRKLLPGETEETARLSTLELQRLVLLEQLRYTRMKIRRLEQSE